MNQVKSILSGLALVVVATVPFNNIAAAKQMTQEEAWHRCLQEVDQLTPRGVGMNDQTRTAQFKACMKKLHARP
jgi:hypothetical protein